MNILTNIGKVVSLHGFKGELLIQFSVKFDDLLVKELLFFQFEGMIIPFFIEEAYKKSKTRYAITFRDVDSVEKANELLDATVLTPASNIKAPDKDPNDYLIGFAFYDESKYIGKVTEFLSMSANDLLVVFSQDKNKEVFVPFNQALIEEIDEENKIIRFNLPEGLLDIND